MGGSPQLRLAGRPSLPLTRRRGNRPPPSRLPCRLTNTSSPLPPLKQGPPGDRPAGRHAGGPGGTFGGARGAAGGAAA